MCGGISGLITKGISPKLKVVKIVADNVELIYDFLLLQRLDNLDEAYINNGEREEEDPNLYQGFHP